MKKKVLVFQCAAIVVMVLVTIEFVCISNIKLASHGPRLSSQTVDLTRESSPSDFRYSFTEDGSGVIINEYKGVSSAIVIPEMIQGKPVVEVRGLVKCEHEFGHQFYDNTAKKYVFPKENLFITHIVYPDCVQKISWTCSNLNALTYVKLPAGLYDTTIREIWENDGPFDRETKQRIPTNKFAGIYNCKNLTTLIIPEGITNISNLSGNPSLQKVTLPSTIRYIADRTFSDCTSLTELNIPSSVHHICFNVYDSTPGGGTSITDGFFTFRKTNLSATTQSKLKYLGYSGSFN